MSSNREQNIFCALVCYWQYQWILLFERRESNIIQLYFFINTFVRRMNHELKWTNTSQNSVSKITFTSTLTNHFITFFLWSLTGPIWFETPVIFSSLLRRSLLKIFSKLLGKIGRNFQQKCKLWITFSFDTCILLVSNLTYMYPREAKLFVDSIQKLLRLAT